MFTFSEVTVCRNHLITQHEYRRISYTEAFLHYIYIYIHTYIPIYVYHILNLTPSIQNGLTVDSGMIMKIGGVGSVETQIGLFKYILHGVLV